MASNLVLAAGTAALLGSIPVWTDPQGGGETVMGAVLLDALGSAAMIMGTAFLVVGVNQRRAHRLREAAKRAAR